MPALGTPRSSVGSQSSSTCGSASQLIGFYLCDEKKVLLTEHSPEAAEACVVVVVVFLFRSNRSRK